MKIYSLRRVRMVRTSGTPLKKKINKSHIYKGIRSQEPLVHYIPQDAQKGQ
jgi:hypothetical protein